MAKQSITLKVARKSYSMDIESDQEELYRLAEREVNTLLTRAKQLNYTNWTDQDYIAVVALQFATAYVTMRQSREIGDEDLKRLKQLDEKLDNYLNALEG